MINADAIYFGGTILTMEGDEPRCVEAIATVGDAIAYVGDLPGAFTLRVQSTRMIDIAGNTMLPGFISTHGRVWRGGALDDRAAEAALAARIAAGFTTTQEWGATAQLASTWRELGAHARLAVDVVAYPALPAEAGYLVKHATHGYSGRFRIGGVALTVNAASPSEDVDAMVATAFEHRWQVSCECDCDGSLEVFLAAVGRAAAACGNTDRRTVVSYVHRPSVQNLIVMRELGVILHSEALAENGYVALKALTEWPAHWLFEDDKKGTLAPGKLADLVILARDPLEVPPELIGEVPVVETIKEGTTVHLAGGPPTPTFRRGTAAARRVPRH